MFRFFKNKADSAQASDSDTSAQAQQGVSEKTSADRVSAASSPEKSESEASRNGAPILSRNGSGGSPHDGNKASLRTDSKTVEDFDLLEGGSVKAGSVSKRLDAAGYSLPQVPKPVAAYIPAKEMPSADKKVRLIQTSGQLPMVDGSLAAAGKVGHSVGMLSVQYAYQLAKVCALNALAAAADVAGGLDRITGVAKVTVFVASHPDFVDQARVANGVSELFGELFEGGHARSAVGVAVLPLDAPVEIEVTFTAK